MSKLSRLLRKALHPMLLVGTGAVWAQSATPLHGPPAQPQPAQPRSANRLPESVRRVERETGGEVLRAEPMQRDGREVYRLKVLTADGRVRVVQDDPDRPRERKPAGRKDAGSNKGKVKQEPSSRDSDETPPQ